MLNMIYFNSLEVGKKEVFVLSLCSDRSHRKGKGLQAKRPRPGNWERKNGKK
jgi:hypothetical protein